MGQPIRETGVERREVYEWNKGQTSIPQYELVLVLQLF